MSGMTAEEKEKYLFNIDKMGKNSATRQDMIDNGNIIKAVMDRLPNDQKEIVENFLNNAKKKYGKEMLRGFRQITFNSMSHKNT